MQLQHVGGPVTEDNDRVRHPQTENDRNQKDTDETASWKRRDRPWFALLEFALSVEVPRGIADERDSADHTVTPTGNKTKMNGFVEISTLLIHSAPKQKSNEWMHLSPFYTRMHGEWLRYAKSTSQFHWRFLLVRDVRGFQVNPLCRHDITRSDRQIGNRHYSCFQLLTSIVQYWNHIFKTVHTFSDTEVYVDQTVNNFSLLSDKMQTHFFQNPQTLLSFIQSPIHLSCMSLDCGRNPEETNIDTERRYKHNTQRCIPILHTQYFIIDWLFFMLQNLSLISNVIVLNFFICIFRYLGTFSQVNLVNVYGFCFWYIKK